MMRVAVTLGFVDYSGGRAPEESKSYKEEKEIEREFADFQVVV